MQRLPSKTLSLPARSFQLSVRRQDQRGHRSLLLQLVLTFVLSGCSNNGQRSHSAASSKEAEEFRRSAVGKGGNQEPRPETDGASTSSIDLNLVDRSRRSTSEEQQTCQQSEACRVWGECTARSGGCSADSDTDCRRSQICEDGGQCWYLEGACIVKTQHDCELSRMCKTQGTCQEGEGYCRLSCERAPEGSEGRKLCDFVSYAFKEEWHAKFEKCVVAIREVGPGSLFSSSLRCGLKLSEELAAAEAACWDNPGTWAACSPFRPELRTTAEKYRDCVLGAESDAFWCRQAVVMDVLQLTNLRIP